MAWPTIPTIRTAFWGLACWWTALCAAGGLQAQSAITISAPQLLADQTREGLHGIAVAFQLGGLPPAAAGPHYVECQLLDERGQPVAATHDAGQFADRRGHCRDSITLLQTGSPTVSEALFVPYLAMALPSGPARVQVRLRVVETLTGQVRAEHPPVELRFQKPGMRLLQLGMQRIVTFTTNTDGETWDYKFLSPKEIYPDLVWGLRRGQQLVFEGERQKNDTVFTGGPKDVSRWIPLSAGDRITLYVQDFDYLGYSDLIGSVPLDIWKAGTPARTTEGPTFDQVRRAVFDQAFVAMPDLQVTGLVVKEGAVENGITGTKVSLDYAVGGLPADAACRLKLKLRVGGATHLPSLLRIVGPGAVPAGAGQVELIAAKGHLELFMPHFAWPSIAEGDAALQVEGSLRHAGQDFLLWQQQLGLFAEAVAVWDMHYGQWKAGIEQRQGQGGLALSLEYDLPEGYFDDLGKASLTLRPSVTASWGPIDNSLWLVRGPEAAAWQGDHLVLSRATRKGMLDLFLPFDRLPAQQGAFSLQANYGTWLYLADRQTSLGNLSRQVDLDLPELRQVQVGLREATVPRRLWLINKPSLYWELRCGGRQLFKSKPVLEKRSARWPDELGRDLVVASGDSLEVVVWNVGLGEPDKVVGRWKGTPADFQQRGKGTLHVRYRGMRRMTIRTEFAEDERR